MKKLVLSTPSSELVDAYLFEIAKGYGVSWSPPTPLVKESGGDGEPKEAEGDTKVCPGFSRTLFIFESTLNDQPKTGKEGKEEVLDNVKAKVEADVKVPKLPDIPPTEGPEEKTKEERPMDEFEALAKRFEALKKR